MLPQKLISLIVFLIIPTVLVMSKSKKKGGTVADRGLVTKRVNAKEIVNEYQKYSKQKVGTKYFSGTSLLYVTPWNAHGYEVAKTFSNKFDLVSPVWLQIRRQGKSFGVTGEHDIDSNWITEVKKNGKTKIVPRILFDQWTPGDFQSVFTNEYVASACAHAIVDFYKKHNFDGVVVEIWLQLGEYPDKSFIHFLQDFGRDLKAAGLLFVLAVPPPVYRGGYPGTFTRDHLLALSEVVDYFSLMTYDYSNPQDPGANSPLFWVENCIQNLVREDEIALRQKLLVGLNFYGNVYYTGKRGGPVIGSQYIDILKNQEPSIRWDSGIEEHVTEFVENGYRGVLYYPTLFSIKRRLNLIKRSGAGISIWEGGQGLNYFYDLL